MCNIIGLLSVLCPILVYQLRPEQGVCVVTLYKQTARDMAPLCGWKGSIPIGRKLSWAGEYGLRCVPSFIPLLPIDE